MKQSELKRLEALEDKVANLHLEMLALKSTVLEIRHPEPNYPKGGETARKPYERELREPIMTDTSNDPLDLTKILEVGDVVTTERFGDVQIAEIDGMFDGYPIDGLANGIWRTWTREGFWDVYKKEDERLKPKNGKTWSQFIVEKEEKKQQIPTLEKAIEGLKKGLEKFDDAEVEVHMTLKKLKSGGYAPSKIYVTNH